MRDPLTPFQVYEPLWKAGLWHGFLGKIGDCSGFTQSIDAASEYIGQRLLFLAQQHGDTLTKLEHVISNPKVISGEVSAVDVSDGFIGRRTELQKLGCGIAIVSADCVPIIIYSDRWIALVHAGWRGLANGIARKAIKAIQKNGGGERVTVVAGPAAGELYQVGPEVIEAIGPVAYTYQLKDGTIILDPARTVAAIAREEWASCYISTTGTMLDYRYYSHRREGKDTGRNVTFLTCQRPTVEPTDRNTFIEW